MLVFTNAFTAFALACAAEVHVDKSHDASSWEFLASHSIEQNSTSFIPFASIVGNSYKDTKNLDAYFFRFSTDTSENIIQVPRKMFDQALRIDVHLLKNDIAAIYFRMNDEQKVRLTRDSGLKLVIEKIDKVQNQRTELPHHTSEHVQTEDVDDQNQQSYIGKILFYTFMWMVGHFAVRSIIQ